MYRVTGAFASRYRLTLSTACVFAATPLVAPFALAQRTLTNAALADQLQREARALLVPPGNEFAYLPLTAVRMERGDVDGVVAISRNVRAARARESLLANTMLHSTDTVVLFRLADHIAGISDRAEELLFATLSGSLSGTARHALLRRSLLVIRRERGARRAEHLYRVGTALAVFGDLSGAALAEVDSRGPTVMPDYPVFVATVAQTLRLTEHSAADSVYARAHALAAQRPAGKARTAALNAYWTRYLPAPSDTNPLRFLPQIASRSVRQEYVANVVAMHWATGRPDIALHIVDDMLVHGDTIRAVKFLIGTRNPSTDRPSPAPRPDALGIGVDRALALTVKLGNTPVQHGILVELFEGTKTRDPARARTIARLLNEARYDIEWQKAQIRRLMEADPDSALAMARTLQTRQDRDLFLPDIAEAFTKRGQRDAAIRTAALITSQSNRDLTLLGVAAHGGFGNDTTRVGTLVDRVLRVLDANFNSDCMETTLLPAMLNAGRRDQAVRWVRSLPLKSRAPALIALSAALERTLAP